MKILHNILKGASLTGALFVFQACYGMPQSPLYEDGGTAPMSFSLVSHSTGEPLEGIRIKGGSWKGSMDREDCLGITGEDGRCRVEIPYLRNVEGPYLRFEDPSGRFAAKDTTLADLRDRDIVIKLDAIQ
jgi:hypothetical protein